VDAAAKPFSDISVRPGPRAVRATPSAPIYFRRGDRPPIENTQVNRKRRSIGDGRGVDFWASTPVCGPKRDHRDHASILPWALPLAGLSGTHPVHPSGLDPDRITSLRRPTPAIRSAAAHLQSAHGFSASFPTVTWHRQASKLRGLELATFTSLLRRCCRRGSPSLQRIDGADALLTQAASRPGWASSLSEVLHLP